MPIQLNPFFLGVTLAVAIGTIIYHYYASNNQQQEYEYAAPRSPPQTHPRRLRATNVRAPKPVRERTMSNQACSICLTVMTKTQQALECGHVFHQGCINSWLVTSPTCPLCRKFQSTSTF